LSIDLTPIIPLTLKGEGEEILERGFAPLLPALPLLLLRGYLIRELKGAKPL